jgi:hypothetical protein
MTTKKDVTINGIATQEKYFENTLKAVIYSKKISGIPNAQMISFKKFFHEEVKCVYVPDLIKIDSVPKWNFFLIKNLYQFINTDFCLNVHDDGFAINASAWKDEFLNYDYIGALWPVGCHEPIVTEKDRCGNGGFSLRSKKLLEIAALYCPAYAYPNEDRVICGLHRDIFTKRNIKFAPDHIAAQFSIEDETIPEAAGQTHKNRFSIKSFGFHQKNSDAIKFLESVQV